MDRNRRALGLIGEEAAAHYLAENGYTIVERNFRSRAGEIDIIALEGRDLIFVEVKTRGSDLYGAPREAVDWRKKQRLRAAALSYLAKHGPGRRGIRFDVVEVETGADGVVQRISVIKAAF